MSLLIRDATTVDMPAVADLYGREVRDGSASFELEPPSLEVITQRFEGVRGHGLPWRIAELDGRFAGYAYLSPFRPRAAYRYTTENSIYVEDHARGCGVGRALLADLIEQARARGVRHIIGVISQSATSDASHRLHAAAGFQEAGVYRQVGWKFDRWLDVRMMQLDLDPSGAPPSTLGLDL